MLETVLVHGFMFDPTEPVGHKDNPNTRLFPLWEEIIAGPVVPWAWYSCPAGLKHVWRAARAGHFSLAPGVARYQYAWYLARLEGLRLRMYLKERSWQSKLPVNIVCHSLGSRVVLQALSCKDSLDVARVIILNGAETQQNALNAAVMQARTSTLFYNLVVPGDAVLDYLGENFHPEDDPRVIGHDGLGTAMPNWIDFQDGTVFEGDDPEGVGDHQWTYLNPDNRAWLHALVHGKFTLLNLGGYRGVLKS